MVHIFQGNFLHSILSYRQHKPIHIYKKKVVPFFHTGNTNQCTSTKKSSSHSFFIRTGNTNQCLFSKKKGNYLQTVFQNGNRASTREYKFNFEINNIGLKLCVL